MTVTSPADIGRLTTAIYLHQPRIVNEVVFVAGETTSYRQLADTVERVTQQTFSKAVHTCPPCWSSCGQTRMTPCCAIAPPSPGDGVWWRWATRNARHQLPTGHCRLAADRALIFSQTE